MKKTMLLGALVISAMLCGRGYGADMYGRMVSLDEGCQACAQPACDVGCAQPKRCDLFAGLRDMFAARRCVVECEPCEAAKCNVPEPPCAPECAPCRPQPIRNFLRNVVAGPACGQPECGPCEPPKACEQPCAPPECGQPACAEPICGPLCRLHHRRHCRECKVECEACAPPACEKACPPACEKPCPPPCEPPACDVGCAPRCERPVLNFLRNLLGVERRGCVVSDCGCGVEPAPAEAPAPKKANGNGSAAPAPLPQAPNA